MPWDGGHGTSSGRAQDVAQHRYASETATNRGSLRAVHSRIDATLGPGAASKCCRCAGHHLARPPLACPAYQGLRASRARRPDPWLNSDAPRAGRALGNATRVTNRSFLRTPIDPSGCPKSLIILGHIFQGTVDDPAESPLGHCRRIRGAWTSSSDRVRGCPNLLRSTTPALDAGPAMIAQDSPS